MTDNNSDIPREMTGTHPLVNYFNRIIKSIRARTLLPGLGYKIRRTPGGYSLEIIPGAGGGTATTSSVIELFYLQEVLRDVLRCRLVTGPQTDVYIAKPMKLRIIGAEKIDNQIVGYTYHGSFQGRNASLGSFTEVQLITPRYIVASGNLGDPDLGRGDVIVAQSLPRPLLLGGPINLDVTVQWIDMNLDARAWATISI